MLTTTIGARRISTPSNDYLFHGLVGAIVTLNDQRLAARQDGWVAREGRASLNGQELSLSRLTCYLVDRLAQHPDFKSLPVLRSIGEVNPGDIIISKHLEVTSVRVGSLEDHPQPVFSQESYRCVGSFVDVEA